MLSRDGLVGNRISWPSIALTGLMDDSDYFLSAQKTGKPMKLQSGQFDPLEPAHGGLCIKPHVGIDKPDVLLGPSSTQKYSCLYLFFNDIVLNKDRFLLPAAAHIILWRFLNALGLSDEG